MKKIFFTTVVLLGFIFTLISSSCNSSKNAVEIDMTESFKLHPSAYNSDFTAYDSDSTWKLSVRFGEEIIFTSKVKKISFRAKAQPEIVGQGSNIIKLISANETHSIQITIDVAKCKNTGYITDILLTPINSETKEEFSGCGQYNGSRYLYDIWVLTNINNSPLTPDNFRKQLPFMELNLRDKSISGFGGCNKYSAEISFSYKKMAVGPIAATKIFCIDESQVEKEFFNVLNSSPVTYIKKNNVLILENSEGTLTFKKVD